MLFIQKPRLWKRNILSLNSETILKIGYGANFVISVHKLNNTVMFESTRLYQCYIKVQHYVLFSRSEMWLLSQTHKIRKQYSVSPTRQLKTQHYLHTEDHRRQNPPLSGRDKHFSLFHDSQRVEYVTEGKQSITKWQFVV